MTTMQPEVGTASGGIAAPKTPFAATPREQAAALWMYPLAFLYIRMFDAPHGNALLAAFTLGFVALTEHLHRDAPRRKESWVWLGCVAALLASVVFERGRAWDGDEPLLFLHVFAVWWALSRSGALLEGESGRMLPLDALDGFVLFPLEGFFLRLRTVGSLLAGLRGERRGEAAERETVLWSLVMSAAALGLLSLSFRLLLAADSGFAALLDGLRCFEWRLDEELFLDAVLSLPVGAWLYGLLDGTLRKDKTALRRRASAVEEQMELLRGVPERVWLVLLALFCALYALFFAVQGRYLFGAFTRTLPEGFIVSEYARQGFFELCGVMAVNFALLWLVLRSSKTEVREQRAARALCLVLLAESLLLSVVALSKLALYIDCFGFTPKRLQSTWLVCVLAFGCGCCAWSLTRGGRTLRAWMIFGAVTLAGLCLY